MSKRTHSHAEMIDNPGLGTLESTLASRVSGLVRGVLNNCACCCNTVGCAQRCRFVGRVCVVSPWSIQPGQTQAPPHECRVPCKALPVWARRSHGQEFGS